MCMTFCATAGIAGMSRTIRSMLSIRGDTVFSFPPFAWKRPIPQTVRAYMGKRAENPSLTVSHQNLHPPPVNQILPGNATPVLAKTPRSCFRPESAGGRFSFKGIPFPAVPSTPKPQLNHEWTPMNTKKPRVAPLDRLHSTGETRPRAKTQLLVCIRVN